MSSMGMRQFGGDSELVVPPSTEDLRDSRCGSNLSLLQEGANSLHYSNPTLLASPPTHPLCPNLGHQAHQNNNQSLVETRFNGTPQLSPSTSNHQPQHHHRSQQAETITTMVAKPNRTSSSDDFRKQRAVLKKDLQRKFERWDKDTHDRTRCNLSFVFDPAGRLCYYWSMVVSFAFLYNFWVIIFRFSFAEITWETLLIWFSLDYLMDLIYLLDIIFHFRTGYLEDGVLQTDSTKLRQHYMNSTTFYVDCLCLLPLDFLYLSLGFKSILRVFRLVKVYQFWAFMDRSERHTNYPNLLRFVSLIHYLLLVFHWNACLFHLLFPDGFNGSSGGQTNNPSPWEHSNYPHLDEKGENDSFMTYLKSVYWTVLAMTTIGDIPWPKTQSEFLYVIFELVIGLITFATVLGFIANIVTNVSAARKDFQAKLDGVKTYMRMRRVPNSLQNKVIKWFDYLWLTQKSSDEEKSVSCLPDKLKGEIAIHVHLDTLKRVEIFQNTEAGFLCELVLRLRPVLFSPGDYICRKGEVGKEMYICARGRLEVVVDDGKTVLATLKAGSYFGEISILNMGTAGNRRTASVRSVGYSDLFVLSKKDMWDVLKDYPAARVRLEAIAVKRLEKYKKAPLEKAALPRSESTPGLVESKGQVPLEEMWVSPLPYNPAERSPTSERSRHRKAMDSPSSELSTSRSQSVIGGIEQLSVHGGAHGYSNTVDAYSSIRHHNSSGKTTHHPKQLVVTTGNGGHHRFHSHHHHHQQQHPHPQQQQFHQHHQLQHQQQFHHQHYQHQSPPPLTSQGHPSSTHVLHMQALDPPPPGGSASSGNGNSNRILHQIHQSGSEVLPHHSSSRPIMGSVGSSSSTVTSAGPAFSGDTGSRGGTTTTCHQDDTKKEELLLEIQRLRERIKCLETDNASVHNQLSKTQKDVNQRLAEIEMQIHEEEFSFDGNPSPKSSEEEEENNRESFI